MHRQAEILPGYNSDDEESTTQTRQRDVVHPRPGSYWDTPVGPRQQKKPENYADEFLNLASDFNVIAIKILQNKIHILFCL